MKIVRWTATLVGIVVAASAVALGSASAHPDKDESPFEKVRKATEKYHDEARAVADGYERTNQCVPRMGYHYIHPKLFAKAMDHKNPAEPDPQKPPALIYAPDGSGGRTLIAVEYFALDRDQNVNTHNRKIPALFGRAFDGPMAGHFPGMPVHYDLHAYIWTTNPNGTLAPENPRVTCPTP